MKRHLALFATLLAGILIGTAIPLAIAHPVEECVCACPECPPVLVAIPPQFDEDAEAKAKAEAEQAEKTQKALAAIEKYEEAEAEAEANDGVYEE